jgi:histone acetyltransferase (RNA polymerase elongator complex component)
MNKNHITIPVFIPHLGCPHRCSFCNQWSSSGTVTPPDTGSMNSIIDKYLEGIKPESTEVEIAFFGGSFTGIDEKLQEEYLSAADRYLNEGLISGIRASTRPDYINKDKIKLLKRYNVKTIELGVQSFNDKILEKSERGHTADESIAAVKILKDHGFKTVIQLMPGLPGDSMEISLESAEITARLKPDAVRSYPAVVLKNTGLEKLYLEGKFHPLSIDSAVETCKEMLEIFGTHNIPVIRIGLHPFAPEDIKSIVDGPYHPAFGFLVKSRLKRDRMERCIKNVLVNNPGSGNLMIEIPGINPEEYVGHRKDNISYLKTKYKLENLEYRIGSSSGNLLSVKINS